MHSHGARAEPADSLYERIARYGSVDRGACIFFSKIWLERWNVISKQHAKAILKKFRF